MNRTTIPTPRQLITEMRCAACMARVDVGDSDPNVLRLNSEGTTDEFDAYPLCDGCWNMVRLWLDPKVHSTPVVAIAPAATQATRDEKIPSGVAMRACH